MEPSHLCTRQIIAASKNDVVSASENLVNITAGIALSDSEIDSINSIYSLPTCGVYLDCPKISIDPEYPATEHYIYTCKKDFKERMSKKPSFYYIRGADTFQALRSAVIAVTDVSGKAIMAEVHTTEEARMCDNTDALAALGVLQRIGVSTVVFTSDTAENLEDTLERVAPYARISVGVRIPAKWLDYGIKLTNVEVLLPYDGEDVNMLDKALKKYKSGITVGRDHDDYILAPDGRYAHFIDAVTGISDEIECDHKLQESLLDIEDEEAGALKLVLREEDDLYNFETDLYMLTRPVCLCAETPELLEKALRIYCGLAIYDGTWELETDVIKYFSQKYGMIWL